MPQSVPKGLSREHVLQALTDLDAGVEHPFGSPTGYELVHEGRRYPPKAVIGLACRDLLGRVLLPEEFSGGEAPGQANFVLRELGFTVEKKRCRRRPEGSGQDWSARRSRPHRRRLLPMLGAELPGKPYSKAAHNRDLRPLLERPLEELRRVQAPEHQRRPRGPGAALHRGLQAGPQLPRSLLPQAVEAYLDRHPDFLETLAAGRVLNPTAAPAVGEPAGRGLLRGAARTGSPARQGTGSRGCRGGAGGWTSPSGTPRNRSLGRLGEEFASRSSSGGWRRRPGRPGREGRVGGRDDRRRRGLRRPVLRRARWLRAVLEVKTTGLGKYFPFYVTATEVRCSEDCPERFRLFRVFDFARNPRLYVVPGPLSRECRLEPVVYRASVGEAT